MNQPFLPFLDLFEAMQQAMQPPNAPLGSVPLGLEQYDLLYQALAQGFGLASWDGESLISWENLRRICRLLWVKPLPSYEAALAVFDQTFDRYVETHQGALIAPEPQPQPPPSQELAPNYPKIPPRRGWEPKPQEPSPVKAAAAVKTATDRLRSGKSDAFRLVPQDLPLTLTQVQQSWRSLRQGTRAGNLYEVDIEATVAQIVAQGVLDDVVMRPVMARRAELVLLLDDHDGMVPFGVAIAPLLEAVAQRWVSPARVYRFSHYVDQYLYAWPQAGPQAGPPAAVNGVLAQLHRSRTVLLIVSDAGAALGTVSGGQILAMQRFVQRAAACVRQVIWLNPLPRARWQGTSAQAIAAQLPEPMVELDRFELGLRSQLGGVLR